ncbi:MAG: TlpA family protein disulfide reductase [Acidimicrobiales bacterium]|nr:TlpA family protein disulfide reductase [Acidimicrobiales bacterium]
MSADRRRAATDADVLDDGLLDDGLLDDEIDRDDVLDDGSDPGASSARRGRFAAFVVVPVAIVALLFVVLLATREPSSRRSVDSPLLGRPAPSVQGTTLSERPFDSATYDGRWLVVNFFATWCGPCIEEHPELVAFHEAHAETGDANVVSIVFEDDEAGVQRFFTERGGDWPVVFAESTVVADWGVVGVPETYVVDPSGVVVAKLVGGVTQEILDGVLERAR